MRILFVNRMAAMVRGGGETFDLEMARHLDSMGCKTSFLCGIPVFGRALNAPNHPHMHLIRSPYSGHLPWDRIPGGWRLRMADFHIFEQRAVRWAKQHQGEFDVIQVCELPTFVHSWKKSGGSLPVVMRLTAPDFYDPHQAVQRADRVIASGTTIAKVREALRPDCVNISNGVDTELFKPGSKTWRREEALEEDDFVILFVARFQSVKNHRMLFQAVRNLLDAGVPAKLVCVGSGPLEAASKSRVNELNMAASTVFLGEVEYQKLPAIYAAADVKVISSDYESFCFAALEGMAAGLPFVVTATDWVPTMIVDGEGGWVTPVGDASAFGEALLRLYRDQGKRVQMGARNREVAVERYGWRASASKLLDVYREIADAS